MKEQTTTYPQGSLRRASREPRPLSGPLLSRVPLFLIISLLALFIAFVLGCSGSEPKAEQAPQRPFRESVLDVPGGSSDSPQAENASARPAGTERPSLPLAKGVSTPAAQLTTAQATTAQPTTVPPTTVAPGSPAAPAAASSPSQAPAPERHEEDGPVPAPPKTELPTAPGGELPELGKPLPSPSAGEPSVADRTAVGGATRSELATPTPSASVVPVPSSPSPATSTPSSPATAPSPQAIASPELKLAEGSIAGKMTITFDTRREIESDGRPKPGAYDTYLFSLSVSDAYQLSGSIKRYPRLLSSVLGREVQLGRLEYAVQISSLESSLDRAKKSLGGIAGTMIVDAEGRYVLAHVPGATLAQSGANGALVSAPLEGVIVGKNSEQRGKLATKLREYARTIGGRRVTVSSSHIDPLEFKLVSLAPAPGVRSGTLVSGNLDYDYDTGNWYTNGVRFENEAHPAKTVDFVTGSIKWTEDPRRDLNGRGFYEFNLRWNEESQKKNVDEGAYFENVGDEELFFAVDPKLATLSGKMLYEDEFGEPGEDGERPVVRSTVKYELRSAGLTKEQLVQFLKLWLLIVGPVNDE